MADQSAAADSLIASLQADLTAHQGQAEEAQLNKRRLDAAETRASELTTALAEARKEVASLTAKLSVSRSAEAAAASSIKVPGSAVKGSKPASRAAAAASSEALQVAQLKEDLYGDLTGIIIRGVKRDETSDAFDCILTGRNGSKLRYALSVMISPGKPKLTVPSPPLQAHHRQRGRLGKLRRNAINLRAPARRRPRPRPDRVASRLPGG